MNVSSRAGRPATQSELVDVPKLVAAYYTERPDVSVETQRIQFGTSGHRGSSRACSFNEAHILAVTQAVCLYRRERGIEGPLFLGWDTHALSEPARRSALEVLAGNAVEVMLDSRDRFTPTPVISQAVLEYNRGRTSRLADGIVITPSHNPPEFGGIKYDPPTGGPADASVTAWIEARANELLAADLVGVTRCPFERAQRASTNHLFDYRGAYVEALGSVIDFDALRGSTLTVGVDPLGGASIDYWEPIARALQLADRGREPRGRSDISLHDGRLGWGASHGPVLSVCHAAADRPTRSLRPCRRHRSGRGPARDRESRRGAHEPQPLPGGRDRLSVQASAAMACGGSDRQDDREQQSHRSR